MITSEHADLLMLETREVLDYARYLTPINYVSENKIFLYMYHNGEKYNPSYKYETFPPFSDELLIRIKKLKEYKCGDNPNELILQKSIETLMMEIMMYSFIGDDDHFYKYAVNLFGKPSNKYALFAKEVLQEEEPIYESNVTSEDLKKEIDNRLNIYGIDWNVILKSRMASRISVEPNLQEIHINKNAKFSQRDLKRLLYHEVDTHVLRAVNGYKRGLNIYATGTPNSLMTEEGLALYNEFVNKVQDIKTIKLYAARYLACMYIDKDFYSIFNMLIEYGCSEEIAIYVVPRIKRGLSDTSNPGGFIKDYVYFQGMIEIKNAIEKNPDIYNKLYFGSISLDDVPLLQEIIDKTPESDFVFPIK